MFDPETQAKAAAIDEREEEHPLGGVLLALALATLQRNIEQGRLSEYVDTEIVGVINTIIDLQRQILPQFYEESETRQNDKTAKG